MDEWALYKTEEQTDGCIYCVCVCTGVCVSVQVCAVLANVLQLLK